MSTGLACSHPTPRSIPTSVINACPYDHYPIVAGPITEEIINNILLNHDLDHKCIEYLKDLLGRTKHQTIKDSSNDFIFFFPSQQKTLNYVTPLAHYYVSTFGFEHNSQAIDDAMNAWNEALPRKIVQYARLNTPNIVLTPWPYAEEDNTLGEATSIGLMCYVKIRMDLAPHLVAAVVAHELGHCFGLDHNQMMKDSLMYPTMQSSNPRPDPISVGILEDFNPYF